MVAAETLVADIADFTLPSGLPGEVPGAFVETPEGDGFRASNWETVTNLKPRRNNPSSVAGIASTVGLCKSWANTIDPFLVLLSILDVTTDKPGRLQSSGSTFQRMVG